MDRTLEAEVILELALEQPAGRRESFLASACSSPELLRELTALLPWAEGDADFLHSPVPRPVMPDLVKLRSGDLGNRSVAELSGLPERIGGYQLIRFLGSGGTAMTFEARQVYPPRAVALKVLHPGPVTPEILRLFQTEARLLRRFASPWIVEVFAAGLDQVTDPNGRPYPLPFLAMELVQGEPLDRFSTRPELSVADRLAVFVRICAAVDHVHQRGVIHLDLKPSNVLVQDNGEPKIVDFGIGAVIGAADEDATDSPVSRSMLGSIAYMSPERLRGGSPVGVEADVYSLGVILGEMLTGRLAAGPLIVPRRTAGSPARFPAGDLSLVAQRATATEPSRRHPSAAALASDVRRAARGLWAAERGVRGFPLISQLILSDQDQGARMRDSSQGVFPPIVIDLGKIKSKLIRDFKKGRGELVHEVEQALAETRQSLGGDAARKELVPVVLVYRKKQKRRRNGLFFM